VFFTLSRIFMVNWVDLFGRERVEITDSPKL